MSLCAFGLSAELKGKVSVNGITMFNNSITICTFFNSFLIAIWPMTAIETSAVSNLIDPNGHAKTRTPQIVADAALLILKQPLSFT